MAGEAGTTCISRRLTTQPEDAIDPEIIAAIPDLKSRGVFRVWSTRSVENGTGFVEAVRGPAAGCSGKPGGSLEGYDDEEEDADE